MTFPSISATMAGMKDEAGKPDNDSDPLSREEVEQLIGAGLIPLDAKAKVLAEIRKGVEWPNWLRRWTEALGAIFLMAGTLFFFAHNWKVMSPILRFSVLEGAILITVVCAIVTGIQNSVGQWLLSAACVLTGILLAVYGQVYQTGADAFEVFALWSALILIWVVLAKFAPLWFFWLVVTETAMILFAGQVLVPDGIATWISIVLGLGMFTITTLIVFEWLEPIERFNWLRQEWLRVILVTASIFWLSAIPFYWIFDNWFYFNEKSTLLIVGKLCWLAAVSVGFWFYSKKKASISSVSVCVLSAAFIAVCWLGETQLGRDWGNSFNHLVTGITTTVIFSISAILIIRVSRKKHDSIGSSVEPSKVRSSSFRKVLTLKYLQEQGWINKPSAIDSQLLLSSDRKNGNIRTPWVARFALGFGALMAGFFLTMFVSLDFTEMILVGMGLFFIAGSVVFVRLVKGIYSQQLALAWNVAGYFLFLSNIHELSSFHLTAIIGAVILCPLVYRLSKDTMQQFFSVSWIWVIWLAVAADESGNILIFTAVLAALTGVIIGLSSWKPKSCWRPVITACVSSLLLLLVCLSAGKDWLFDGFSYQLTVLLGVIAAIAFSGLLWHLVRPAMWQIICFGAVLIAIAFAGVPGVVTGIGLMAAAHARGNRRLEWVGIISLGVFLIQFYYQMNATLMTKSLWLLGIGTAMLALRFFALRKTPAPEIEL